MAIPDRVPITYEPDYHTRTIGRYDEGQFFAWVVATLGDSDSADDDWPSRKRWYAVLHRFDDDGAHAGSTIEYTGTSVDEATSVDRARARVDELVAALPGVEYGDIAIRLFQVEVDGEVFGLVDWSEEYDGDDHAEFLPGELGFDPPWDGAYDT
ncbi:hypothetical protein [Dactylosporangium sp. NPDC005555]|uniref:hypothetical protein n=1 Tax=Dactylosporangium sp. NPDC005555 TaxID=3154889 RepID=UPI0033B964FD